MPELKTDKSIDIEVEYGTVLTNLFSTFTLSAGASAKVGGVAQVSGTTENDFNQLYFKVLLNTYDHTPVGVAKAYLPKAVKFLITRVNESNTSSIEDRYLIQKIYL